MRKTIAGAKIEQVVNDAMARVLDARKQRWNAEAERSLKVGKRRVQPDILVEERGKECVGVETELEPGRKVEADAQKYLGLTPKGVGEIRAVVAVKMPKAIAETPGREMETACRSATMRVAVLTKRHGSVQRWPEEPGAFVEMDLPTLSACIEHNQVAADRVERAAEALEAAIEKGADAIESVLHTHPKIGEEVAGLLRQAESRQTWAMATAILTNAVAFHATLAGSGGEEEAARTIRSPEDYTTPGGRPKRKALREEWRRILREVNYWPIFSIGETLLGALQEEQSCTRVLKACLTAAEALRDAGALQAQEVMGKALQSLIVDRHILKTHYTLPESATLMAETIIARMREEDPDRQWTATRVLDPACGTGALLSAMQVGVLREAEAQGADARKAHLEVLRNFHGLEVMPAAAHLTATQLSSVHPTVIYRRSSIATTHFGPGDGFISLGALDFLSGSNQEVLFQGNEPTYVRDPDEWESAEEVKATRKAKLKVIIEHGYFDVVVMNPPFTSDTKHDGTEADIPLPSWAAFETSPEKQALMRKERQHRVREMHRLRKTVYRRPRREAVGDGNAGLGSWFVDLAHEKLKPGGVLGVILPHSAASGKAWRKLQALLRERYENVVVFSIASTSQTGRAFSSDTGMAECMIVARKRKQSGEGTSITLHARPESRMEAHAVARMAAQAAQNHGSTSGMLEWEDRRSAGAWARETVGDGAGSAGATKPELIDAVRALKSGWLRSGRTAHGQELALTKMRSLGPIGPVDRDLGWRDKGKKRSAAAIAATRGPLRVVAPARDGASFPCLWNHDRRRERHIVVTPDSEGRTANEKERVAASQLLDEWAATTHLNRDFRINSQSLSACLTAEPCLGGRAWPNFKCPHPAATVLWENTTPGLMLCWWEGNRTQEGRSCRTVTSLPEHTTLDTRTLSAKQRKAFESLLEEMVEKPDIWTFGPANEAVTDPTRRKLDDRVLEILGVEAKVVEAWWKTAVVQWCNEPSVHGGKGRQKGTAKSQKD